MARYVKAAIAALPALSILSGVAEAGPVHADVFTFQQPNVGGGA